jgi:hypothetical protein
LGAVKLRWSPDGEVLALLTAEGRVVLMSPDWEVFGEVDCGPEDEEADGRAAEDGTLSWRGDAQLLAVNIAWADERYAVPCLWNGDYRDTGRGRKNKWEAERLCVSV